MDPALKTTLVSVGLVLLGGVMSWILSIFTSWRANVARKASDLEVERKSVAAMLAADNKASRDQLASDLRAAVDRLTATELKLSLVSQAVLPISTAFQAILIKELTHFHTPRMDELMVKLGPPFSLTVVEEQELITALVQRTTDMGDKISDSERDAAKILPFVMKRARIESSEDKETQHYLQLVMVNVDIRAGEIAAPKTQRDKIQATGEDTNERVRRLEQK